MKREPIQIGDRVRVKDLDQSDGRACSDKGRVIAVSSDGVKVIFDNWQNLIDPDGEKGMWFFPRQVRKVKLKPKAPPVKREEPIVRYMLEIDGIESINKHLGWAQAQAGQVYPKCAIITRLVECPDSSRVLSREELARAFVNHVGMIGKNTMFPVFCKALGFAEAGGGE